MLVNEDRCAVNGYNELRKRFGCRSNKNQTHCWRAMGIKPLFFAMYCMMWIASWILSAPNPRILCVRYSEHVKGTPVRKNDATQKNLIFGLIFDASRSEHFSLNIVCRI